MIKIIFLVKNYFYRKTYRNLFFVLESSLKAVEEYLRDPDFNPDAIRRVSFAAAGLCAWAINIVQYYRVYCEVEPKRLAAEEATEQLRQTEEQFNATQAKLAVRIKRKRRNNKILFYFFVEITNSITNS
jgi:Microtubule-binding stalk of dynein motor